MPDDRGMGLFSWLFGRKDPAPPVAVEKPAQEVQIVEPAAPAVSEVPAPLTDPPAHAEEKPRRRAYMPPPDTPENRRIAAFYDAQRAQAKAEGKSVKQLRSGLIGAEETKASLAEILDNGTADGLRLGSCAKGLTIALPDGRLIDCSAPMLRKFRIYGAKITGTGYYKAGEYARPERMQLGMKRDPSNEHDSNAVALTRGNSRPQQLGWLAKGQARFVAKELDAGAELVAHVVMDGRYVLVTTSERWEQLTQ